MKTTFGKWVSVAFNSSILEKKRHVWIDYLRGIIIILVVYHHTFLGMAKSGIFVPQSIIDANMAAYSFRMPLFFIFSGMFTGLSLCSKPVKKIVSSKFNLLFYPYIIWSVIQITLQIIFSNSNYTNSDATFLDYTYILYQPKQIAHFWYLPALFNATMIFIFIKTRFQIKAGPHLLLGIILFLLAPFTNSISMISNCLRFYIFLAIGDSLSGFFLKKENQEQLRRPWYFLGFIPIFLIAQFYYFNVIGVRSLENDSATLAVNYASYIPQELGFLLVSLIGCTTFILLSFLIEKWNRWQWLRIVGFHSLYIYIMHVIVVGFVRYVFINFFGAHTYMIILPAAVFFGVTVPIVFYNLIGKKYLWFLFTTRKAVNESTRFKEPNVRTSDVRLTPLPSGINNI